MIEYAKFLFKRILCRKSNVFLIITSVLLLSGILIMNIRSQDELRNTFRTQIETNQNEIEKYKSKLTDVSADSNEYRQYTSQIEFLESNTQIYEEMIELYDNEKWSLFYQTYINVLEEQMGIINPMDSTSNHEEMKENSEMRNYFSERLEYIKYLDKHNLEYEDKSFPVFGLSFVTYISQDISPIMILVCCIYILAQIFTMDFSKGINISGLFPMGKIKTFLVKVIVSIIVSVSIFSLVLLCTFLIATLLTSNTGIEYPLMIQDSYSKAWSAVNLMVFFKEWLIVGSLFFICSGFFTYILSLFIKEDSALFLTSICMILGVAYLPSGIGFLRGISHFLPTTYINFIDVASGKIAIEYNNVNISFFMGVLILTLFIVLQFSICIISEQFKKYKN